MQHQISFERAHAYTVKHGTRADMLMPNIVNLFQVQDTNEEGLVSVHIFGSRGHETMLRIDTYHEPHLSSRGFFYGNPDKHFALYQHTAHDHTFGHIPYAHSATVISEHDQQVAGYVDMANNGILVSTDVKGARQHDLHVIDYQLDEAMLRAMILTAPLVLKLFADGKLRVS